MSENADEIAANLERAETSLRAARDLLDQGYYDIAASRAYYAAFYSASALLLNDAVAAKYLEEFQRVYNQAQQP